MLRLFFIAMCTAICDTRNFGQWHVVTYAKSNEGIRGWGFDSCPNLEDLSRSQFLDRLRNAIITIDTFQWK